MRLHPAPILPLLALALFLPSGAQAYEYMAVCSDGTPAHWPAGQPITYHLSSSHPSNDLADAAVRAAAASSWEEWARPACADVVGQLGEPAAVDPFDEADERVVIGFYEQAWPPELGVGLLALTRITYDLESCEIADADIVFNGVECDWIQGVPQANGEKDFQAVLTHELGHVLGLDHTEVAGSSMKYPYADDLAWRTLGCDDTAGVCDLYTRGDASCSDSAYCPCGHPCVDGVCEGLDFDPEAGECWSWFAPEETWLEEEPNDTSPESFHVESEGGDLVIDGSLHTCGNDGAQPIGDQDWLDVDAPCEGRAWITLEPTAEDADVDLFVYVDAELSGEDQARTTGEVAGVEVVLSNDFQVYAYCWEGSPTNWTLRVHYLAPGELPPGETDEPDCGCAQGGGARELGLAGLLLMVLPGRRRRG